MHSLTACNSLATNYIIQLDKTTRQMQTRLAALESEVQRLRAINEKITLSVGSTPDASMTQPVPLHSDRPLSPPPEMSVTPLSLPTSNGDAMRDDSGGSGSDGDL